MLNQKHWLAGLTIFGVLLASACSRKTDTAAEEEPPAPVAEVTLTKVARGNISRILSIPAVVVAVPNQDVKVSPLVGGRITELTVTEGERVTKGQIVARLDEGPLRDEARRTQAAVAQAKAGLENATLALARNQKLLERGIAARKEVEDARTAQQVAEAALQQAEAEVAVANLQLKRAQVEAPLNGVVVKRFVNVGEQVDGTSAQPLVEVADLAEVELASNVPPEELSKLRVGQAITFATSVFPGHTYSGRIVTISSAVEPASNTAAVRIRVPNPDGLLRMEMNLTAELPIETHLNALIVPPQSIYRNEENEPRIYVVEGDRAKAVPVEMGIETTDHVELLSGVSEGVTVILDGGYGLEDESKVVVKASESPESK